MTGLLAMSSSLAAAAEPQQRATALAKLVAPFVDETTVAVIHGDISRLEEAPFVSMAFDLLPEVRSISPEEKKEAIAEVNSVLAAATEKSCNDVFLVVNFRPAEYPVMLIVPFAEGMDRSDADALVDKGRWLEAVRLHGALFAGDPRARERLEAHRPAPRPELLAAFEAVGNTEGQLIILPPKHAAPFVEAMLPTLPDDIPGDPIGMLIRYLKHVKSESYGLNLSPKKSLTLVVQVENAEAAAALNRDWIEMGRILADNEQLREILPNCDEVISLVTPTLQGDRLSFSIDKPEQVDMLMDAAAKLLKSWDRLIWPTGNGDTGASEGNN
jgi:hypothetical protein